MSRRNVWIALLTVCCAGCRTPGFTGTAGFEKRIRTELYFGRSIRTGAEVSDADWVDFVAKEIAPRFPGGFTVLDARGHWRSDAGRVVVERSKVVIIIHRESPNARMHLFNIIGAYKRRFRQEAVLRVVDRVGVTF
jgi:hypothetical protein